MFLHKVKKKCLVKRIKFFFQFVPIYAAYLYDSVKLYARALHHLLSQEPFIDDAVIDRVASNGTKIIETIISNKTYESKFLINLFVS